MPKLIFKQLGVLISLCLFESVLSIDLLSVKLRTFDNQFIRMPNENLIKTQVTNLTIIVITTNPVDVLTYAALKKTGWPRNRIFGSGTVLDSARFRHLLSTHCGVDVKSVHANILGEHGDSEVAAWSMTHLGGMPMNEFCPVCRKCGDWNKERDDIVDEVRDSAYHIIDAKGSTCYAIGLALVRIISAILRNEHSILTVFVLLEGLPRAGTYHDHLNQTLW